MRFAGHFASLSAAIIFLAAWSPAVLAQPMAPAVEPTAPAVEPAAPSAPAQPEVVSLPEGVVATVNGEAITEDAWVADLKRVAGRSVLQFMIRHILVRQAARQQGVTLSESELQAVFDKKVAEAGGVAQLESALRNIGESLQDFKERLHTETLLRRMAEKGVTVSDDELHQFFLEEYGRRAEVQVIVVDTREKADAALAQVKAGMDFGQVASQVSMDRTTAGNHGYLPVLLSEGIWPKSYGAVVVTEATAGQIFALPKDGVTPVIPGAQGVFCVFRLAKLYPAKDIRFDDVRESVRRFGIEYKVQNRAAQILQQLLNSAVIKIDMK